MTTIRKIINDVLAREESTYTNDPNDAGGPTRHGITQATLAKWRKREVSADEVRMLTEDEARAIYYARYVQEPNFGPILEVSPPIAQELVDAGVNLGPAQATTFLQRSLNVLNRVAKDYPDVEVDGKCGPGTMRALNAFLKFRGNDGEVALLRALNSLQGAFYIELAERRERDETFVLGWLLNRVS